MPSKSSSSPQGLRIVLILICMLLVLGGYFVFHKPVTPETAAALGLAFWRIFISLFISALAGGIGRSIKTGESGNSLSSAVLQAGLGLGILSIYILAVGSLIGVNWISLGLVPLIAAILQFRYIKDWCFSITVSMRDIWKTMGTFETCLAVCMLVIFVCALIQALAPPFHYDALMYHLAMPQTYMQQGRITHIPWLVMTGMPQCTEMLYTMAVLLGGLPAAAVTGWMIGLLAVLGIIGFFQSGFAGGSRIGWVAAASLLAGETFASSLAWAYIDWTGLLFGVCCFTCFYLWLTTDEMKMAGLAGLFSGLAFTTKYTGGILFLCSLAAILYGTFHHKKAGRSLPWRSIGFFLAGAAIFPAIWLGRNLILTGNPVYPFFLPAAEMDAVRVSVYQGATPFGEWWEALLLPIRATLWGLESAEGYSVSIGPLLLILSLAGVLRQRALQPTEKSARDFGLVFFLSVWLFWGFGNRLSGYLIQTRMYFSIFPAFAILAALGWDAVKDLTWNNVRFSRLFGAVILIALGSSTLTQVLQIIRQDALRNNAGWISEETYLDQNLGWYAPAMRAVNALPAGSKTLFLYEPRGLACLPACDPDEILDHWKISRMQSSNGISVLELWKQKEYNYLLVNQAGMQFLADGKDLHHPADEVQALYDLLSQSKLVQSFGESYLLYQLP